MPSTMTTYEIAIEHGDGRRYCVRFTNRKSMRGMRDAVRAMAAHLLRVCKLPDDAAMTECRTNGEWPSCRIAEWTVRFTGRTGVSSRGAPLPWVGRC